MDYFLEGNLHDVFIETKERRKWEIEKEKERERNGSFLAIDEEMRKLEKDRWCVCVSYICLI